MSSELKVDTISEKTSANGVSIDGLSIKDGVITAGNPIKEADIWRITANVTVDTPNGFITANWERGDARGANYFGTGLTESSGVFSFPSTGIYQIIMHSCGESGTGASQNLFVLKGTTDNFSSVDETIARTDNDFSTSHSGQTNYVSALSVIIDVTDTSNVKVKFRTEQNHSTAKILGNTGMTRTGATFVRLGNT